MSYSIYLKGEDCPHCKRSGAEPHYLPDPTYNLTPIFDLALTNEGKPESAPSEFSIVILKEKTERPYGLRLLNGRKAIDTLKQLNTAIETLRDPKRFEEFKKLEPENGWGTLEGAIEVMTKLHDAAREYPNNTWLIT